MIYKRQPAVAKTFESCMATICSTRVSIIRRKPFAEQLYNGLGRGNIAIYIYIGTAMSFLPQSLSIDAYVNVKVLMKLWFFRCRAPSHPPAVVSPRRHPADFEFDIPNNTHYLAAADTATCLFVYQRFSRIM